MDSPDEPAKDGVFSNSPAVTAHPPPPYSGLSGVSIPDSDSGLLVMDSPAEPAKDGAWGSVDSGSHPSVILRLVRSIHSRVRIRGTGHGFAGQAGERRGGGSVDSGSHPS